MKRTEVNILSDFSNLDIEEKLLFVGSCFAENIGQKFNEFHLDASINPFGVIFHPISLFQLFERALNDDLFVTKEFFEFQDYWFNYQISSSCAKFDKNDALNFANQKLKELKFELASADRLFLTFGSSVLRKLKDKPVANCHKQPSELFKKEISTSFEILEYIKPILENIFEINPNLKISVSVSPVRHSKEGMVENSLSKSNLIILCHKLKSIFDNIEYIPIYELVVDELRDYSFFKEDLVHPNNQTVEIVWERIQKSIGSKRFNDFCNQSKQLLLSINHKALHPKSKQNILFLNKLLESIIQHEYNYGVNWPLEKEILKNRIKNLA